MIYIIMGVSGCGKSALGAFLSEKLGWPLHEGDHFHPQGNIEKMARGEPLTDQLDGAVSLHRCKFGSPYLSRDVSLVDDAVLNARISVDVLKTTDCLGFSNYMKSLRGRCSRSDALVACSALKRLYRQILLYGSKALESSSGPDHDILPPTPPDVFFLFLHGDYDLIQQRMVARRGHYMKADLLRSQFDVLEPPSDDENVLPLEISRSITDMAVEVQTHIIHLKSST